MSVRRRILVLFLFVSSFSIGFLGLQSVCFVHAEASEAELPPMSLTVVGTNGTEVILNETDIAALPSYRGYGGYKNQLGVLKGFGNYTGVPLSTLFNLVGGLTNTSIVEIGATDYAMNLTYDEVTGDFVTYDPITGVEVPHSQPLVPIVAYYFNDANLSPSDGPLRLAVVGPEGLATNSVYWVKHVVRIQVIDTAVPEFPSFMILPLLLLLTLTVALSVRFRRQLLDHLN